MPPAETNTAARDGVSRLELLSKAPPPSEDAWLCRSVAYSAIYQTSGRMSRPQTVWPLSLVGAEAAEALVFSARSRA